MAEILYDDRAQTWLLQMERTSYGFALSREASSLRHLYWGPKISEESFHALAERYPEEPTLQERNLTWARELPDEYVGWGGMRYDEPSLKVEFADGNRSIDWRMRQAHVVPLDDGATLEVQLADAVYPLRATLSYRIRAGFDVLERWVRLENASDGPPIVVHQFHSASWWLPSSPSWRIRFLHGQWAGEMQLAEASLAHGKFIMESRRGTTGHHSNPWFTLDSGGHASETSGAVWSGALAWSGSWKLTHEITAAGRLHCCGGLNEFDWKHELAARQELTGPVFAGLYTEEGFGGASREWHAWQMAHVLPRRNQLVENTSRPGGPAESHSLRQPPRREEVSPVPGPARGGGVDRPPLRPVLYNSWEATGFSVSEEGQLRLAERAARIGAECFVVDDGWFAGRDDDRAGLGDWTVDRAKFPHGLKPLIDRVHDLGMQFGLWIEPEMVNPDSDLYRAHPDWVYHFAHRPRLEQRNQLMLNLGRPDVADWLRGTVDGLLGEYEIDFVKWDLNRHISDPGWPTQQGGQQERVWVDHVNNLYEIWDHLRAAHPEVGFETCAGGGGRVDLGILRRADQAWPSDNTDAWERTAIHEGFTQIYPPQVMVAWVTDSPNWHTGRNLPLGFRFHVAMAGVLGIGVDLARWSEEEMAEAAELVKTYKSIRPVVQQGRLHRLAYVRDQGYGGNQYSSQDWSEIVVLGWRAPSWAYPPTLPLVGLEPGARYADKHTGEEHLGEVLLREGIKWMPSSAEFDSFLFHLVRCD